MVVTLTLLGSTEFGGSLANRLSREEGFGRSHKNGGKNSNTSTKKQVFGIRRTAMATWICRTLAPKPCQLRMSNLPKLHLSLLGTYVWSVQL